MSILASDLKWYGSASMPDDDTPTNIGGAIDTSKKVEFADQSGFVQIVSSSGADVAVMVTISFRDAAGTVTTEAQTLTGTTPKTFAANMERLLKALKNASTTGDVAVESQTAIRSNTAQAGTADTITLDAGASAVDNFFQFKVIRITSGTGSGQIREIIGYVGSTKVAQVSYAWGTNPDATSVFRISDGMVFEKSPAEILEIRRPFFDSDADTPGGSDRDFYEKVFFKNAHGSGSLTGSKIRELSNPSGLIKFGLAASVNDTGGNGGGNNRQVAPGGVTFDTIDVNVPGGGILTAGDRIGVWLRLHLVAGAPSNNTSVTMRGFGSG